MACKDTIYSSHMVIFPKLTEVTECQEWTNSEKKLNLGTPKFHICSTDSPVILSILIPASLLPSFLPSLLEWREENKGKEKKLTSFTSSLQLGTAYKWLLQYVQILDSFTMSLSYPNNHCSLSLILDNPFSLSMHTSYIHGPLVVSCFLSIQLHMPRKKQ